MNADLTAIIAEVLEEHSGFTVHGACHCRRLVGQNAGLAQFRAHQAEQIAARLLELPAPTFARWWCDNRAERLRALESQ